MSKTKFKFGIITGFLIFTILILINGIIIFNGTNKTMKYLKTFSSQKVHTDDLISKLNQNMVNIHYNTKYHIATPNLLVKLTLDEAIFQAEQKVDSAFTLANKAMNDTIYKKSLEDLVHQQAKYLTKVHQNVILSRRHRDTALMFYQKEVIPAYNEYSIAFDRLINKVIQNGHVQSDVIINYIKKVQKILYAIVVLSLVVFVFFGFKIFRTNKKLRQQNELISKNEVRFTNLMEALPDAIIELDQNERMVYCNFQTMILFDFTQDELLYKKIQKIIPDWEKLKKLKNSNAIDEKKLAKWKSGLYKDVIGFNSQKGELNLELSLNIVLKNEGEHAVLSIRDVSEFKQAEQTIQINEARLRKAQEIAHMGSWELDLLTGQSIWSDEMCLIYGLSKDQNIQTIDSFLSYIHPDDFQFVVNLIKRSQKNLVPTSMEIRIVTLEKNIRHIYLESVFEFNESGKAIGLSGIIKDITEQKLSAQKIEEIELQYKKLFESMQDGIYKSTPSGKFLDVNPAMVSMLGYNNKNELMALNINTDLFVNTIDREKARLEQESGKTALFQIKRKDGSSIWVEDRGKFVKDSNGNLIYNEGLLRDVSARIEAENNLRASEQFNRGVLNSLSQHIAILNKNGEIIETNETWKNFWKTNGITILPRLIKGSNYFDENINTSDPFTKKAIEGIRKVLNNEKKFFVMEYPCQLANQDYWYILRVTLFNSVEPMVVLAHGDISLQKKVELDNSKITKDLALRNKDLEQFAYIISHNLRAPVANIIGFSTMLSEPNLPTEIKSETNRGLQESATKLDQVIRDLNTILQLQGQVHENKEVQTFSEALSKVRKRLANVLSTNLIDINADFSKVNEIVTIKSYLNSVFYNLIINSLNYRKPQSNLVISIRTESTKNAIQLYYNDNGIGYSDEKNTDKLFELYYRGNQNVAGNGVELYLVKLQIELLGGSVHLNTESENPSEIIITFAK